MVGNMYFLFAANFSYMKRFFYYYYYDDPVSISQFVNLLIRINFSACVILSKFIKNEVLSVIQNIGKVGYS